jgi:hypothetical protein
LPAASGPYAARDRLLPNFYAARRIAAASPTSALPTSIIAASSLTQGACRGTEGTATVAVIVVLVVSGSLVDPIVGVAAATSPRIAKVTHRLRITSSLIPRLLTEHPCLPDELTRLQALCHAIDWSMCEQNTFITAKRLNTA